MHLIGNGRCTCHLSPHDEVKIIRTCKKHIPRDAAFWLQFEAFCLQLSFLSYNSVWELFRLQLCLGASRLTIGASMLTIGLLSLQIKFLEVVWCSWCNTITTNNSPKINFVKFLGSECGICIRDSHRSLLRWCTFLSLNSGRTIPLRKEAAHYKEQFPKNILM